MKIIKEVNQMPKLKDMIWAEFKITQKNKCGYVATPTGRIKYDR